MGIKMYKSVHPDWIPKISNAILETLVPPKPFPTRQENEFRLEYSKRFLTHRRATLLIALITWLIFGYWDWVNYDSQVWPYTTQMFITNSMLRLAGAIVIFICLVLFWRKDIHNEKLASILLSSTGTFCCLMAIMMLFIVPSPINYQYYFFGVILIVIFNFSLLYIFAKISLMHAMLLAAILFLSNQFNAALGENLTTAAFYFYFSFCFFGVSHAVRFEVSERERFKRERSLEAQRLIAFRKQQQANKASARAEQEARNAQFERQRSIETMVAAAQERERFIRAAYHDTMQPLAAISSQVMMMKLDSTLSTNDKIIEALHEIERSGRDIGESMRGIYDLFQWGVHDPKLEPVSIKKFFREIERRFAETTKLSNLQFRIHQSKIHNLYVKSDSAMLKRIIENLVSNAIKYTKTGGIILGAVNLQDTLRIDIRDTGIGISSDQLPRIFEEFYQVEDESPGIGLGLPIVRLLIERLPEHELSCASRPDRGSRFSVRLPKCNAPANYTELNLPEISLTGAYIIIVENNKNVLDGLRVLFESFDCIVRTAVNLKDFTQLLDDSPDRAPDVVISDYRLRNNETGSDVARLIEERFDWTTVPIVFYSADLSIPRRLLNKPHRYIERKGTPLESLITRVNEAVHATHDIEIID
jgi:signal transduction histidine kinase/CheY-like chemotaxis protein